MSVIEHQSITLPRGLWRDGSCLREAVLRPLMGADEISLYEQTRHELPVRRATALLQRCVERLGHEAAPDREALLALTAGDREALLLGIRRLTSGESLQARFTCPVCDQDLEMNLQISDLLLKCYEDNSQWHVAGHPEVRFRLPNGADLEQAALLAGLDSRRAAQLIFERCVDGPSAPGLELAGRLAARMAELDPQAELITRPVCPGCGEQLSALLDITTFFFQEIDMRARALLRQVHQIAFHYHWSEAEILALPVARRNTYLELIDQELEAGSYR